MCVGHSDSLLDLIWSQRMLDCACRKGTMKLVIRYAMIEIVLLVFVFSFFTRPAHAGGVVGDGTPGSCTEAALNTALVGGGTVTFNCGGPKTILITSQKTIANSADH